MKYIKLPVDLSAMIRGEGQKRCSEEESIAQYLMMQITSRHGEIAGREDFGCDIWELEFNQLVKLYEWEEIVKTSLIKTVNKYEKRLVNIKVAVHLHEIDTNIDSKKYSEVRRKAVIDISGSIAHTGVPFNFNTSIYVSPLSQ